MLITAQPDLALVGDVGDMADLLRVIETKQPDLVVLDWDDFRSRIETAQQLLELFDEPPMIVALSVHENARTAVFDSGVAGFAYKGAPPSEFLNIIRASHRVK